MHVAIVAACSGSPPQCSSIGVASICVTNILHIYRYRRRKRGSYTKDDLLDPGDDLRPDRSSEGASFDNPLYVPSNTEDMLELITAEVEPNDTEDHTIDDTKVDVSLNEYEPI